MRKPTVCPPHLAPCGRQAPALLTAFILALAFALRVYRLDAERLWWDEGISIYLATRGVAELTLAKDFAIDLHPPVYHLALAGWRAVAGSTVFAVRLFSVIAGVATVAVIYRLGRQLGGPGVGAVASLLLALAPIHVYYSQEARMYSLVPLLGTLYVSLLVGRGDTATGGHRDTARSAWPRWTAVGIVGAVGVLTHYYLALLVAAGFITALAASSPRQLRTPVAPSPCCPVAPSTPDPRRARLHGLLMSHALIAGSGIWWIVLTIGRWPAGLRFDVPVETETHHTLWQFVAEVALRLGGGFALPDPVAGALAAALGALGIAALLDRETSPRRWPVAALILVPIALAFALTAVRPFFYPRFVLFVFPPGLALAAAGLGRIADLGFPISGLDRKSAIARLQSVLGLAIVLAWAVGLSTHFAGPRNTFASEDHQIQIAALRQFGRSGDAVLASYPWQVGYVVAILPSLALDLQFLPDPTDEQVARLLAASGRVWVLSYSANQRWDGPRAEQSGERVGVSSFTRQRGDARIRLFRRTDVAPLEMSGDRLAAIGDDLVLVDATVTLADALLRPGHEVAVDLVWQAADRPSRDLTVFVHLVGPEGPNEQLVTQQDNPPLNGTRPLTSLTTGEVLVDPYRLRLPPTLPPGRYRLQAGLYDPRTGTREPVNRSPDEVDRVIIGRVSVEGPAHQR
ncbi:MAG: glycosyltransferase family 39 protein [Chloroflexi bacterium]|nr:glycosyltransferase family 39 protein [Chloroflexota bacterium]